MLGQFNGPGNQTGGIYFEGLLEPDIFKTLVNVLNVVILPFGPAALYSIVWYERYSSDLHHRTVINQLLSQYCMVGIFNSLTVRIATLLNLMVGPFPDEVCQASILISRTTFLVGITTLLLRQTLKFVYVFQWRQLLALDDDYAALLLLVWNVALSAVFNVALHSLGYFNAELDYHICTGKNPADNIAKSFRYRNSKTLETPVSGITFAEVAESDPLMYLSVTILLSLCLLTFFDFCLP
jgi:hypothetical protein